MMADDQDLRSFQNLCRLFPLPGVVLFPHAILPLHIFEPRYRQLTEDALAEGDRLITIVQQREGPPDPLSAPPAIEDVACLGRIFQHQRLPDGRFNILVLGLRRVELTRELRSEKLYRMAEAKILVEQDPTGPGDARRNDLHNLFREVVSQTRPQDVDLTSLVETSLPLGPLTDLIAYSLGLPPEIKQRLLAETLVASRAEALIEILGQILAEEVGDRPERLMFPPAFSDN